MTRLATPSVVAHPCVSIKAFAAKLGQDQDAVVAALAPPYSEGQTEGFITKLKLVKRSMYGRANFDLLQARFLYAGC